MRSKEEANDYRYFPDPDLLPLEVTEADKARVKATMPELPEAMKARFEVDFGLSAYDASALTSSRDMADYFVATVNAGAEAKPAANWILGAISAKLNAEEKSIAENPVTSIQLAALLRRISDNTISNNAAKQIFEYLWTPQVAELIIGDSLEEVTRGLDALIEAKGLKQESDSGAIEAVINEVLAANQAMVEEFKAGKEKAFNALVGQVMKASKGKANPAQVNEILKKKLAN